MKKFGFLILLLVCLSACGGGGSDSSNNESDTRELSLNQRTFDAIETEGDVDWYHFRAVETNNVLQIRCSGETATPNVEFLVTVYEKDANGNLVRLWAEHAPEGAALPADLTLRIPVDHPKDLYIAVRDLLDDEAAPHTRYCLQLAYTQEATENDTFADATAIGVDDPGTCQTETIGTVGDVDCYSFTAPAAGVYIVQTDFSFYNSTPVRLDINLYSSTGETIYATAGVQSTRYLFTVYLEAGQYYIAVQDQGRDDADAAATYKVCVTSTTVAEVMQNDSDLTAQAMTQDLSAAHPTYNVQGVLAYQQDQDWYAVNVPASVGTEFQTIKLTFTDTVPAAVNFTFQIQLLDVGGTELLSHEYPGGAYSYTVQTRVSSGDHLVVVKPRADATVVAGLDYSLTVEVIGVEDAAESNGDGNDGINEADSLAAPATTVQGKIGFRGDNDWYRINVPNGTAPQILAIDFKADSTSNVEYCVEIMNGGSRWTLSDTYGLDVATQLKTSYYVDTTADPAYFIKVCDCQGDDGDDVAYDLTVTTTDIAPASAVSAFTVPASLNPELKTPIYNSEIDERGLTTGDFATGEAVEVTCAIYPQYAPKFKANNMLLKPVSLDANNQYISDWIAGYVDYQGDQDWYVLDIKPLIPYGGTETPAEWYYDIEVRFFSPGSNVEYTWKLYRDLDPANRVVVERTPGTTDLPNVDHRDGIMAGWASSLVTGVPAAITKIVPDAVDTDNFWLGYRWQNDRYYLGISDFNYTMTSVDPVQYNPVPDDDWGYNAPYYFQVRLTYHPGVANP